MKIISLKKLSIPKIAVLATGLAAALLVATVNPAPPAQAYPTYSTTCTQCHSAAGGSVTATPSTLTPAASAAFTVAIVVSGPVAGDAGFNISIGGVSVVTGGPSPTPTFTANLTAPAADGIYTYAVGANKGPNITGTGSATTFTITVGVPPTTPVPSDTTTTPVPSDTTTTPVPSDTTTTPEPSDTTTVPSTTKPGAPTDLKVTVGDGQATVSWTPSTSGGAATSFTVTAEPGGKFATTTGNSATVTGLTNGVSYVFTVTATNSAGTAVSEASAAVIPSAAAVVTAPEAVVVPAAAAVIPVGSPATGAGGSADSGVNPLVGLGGLALLLAGASATQITRRRRQV